MIRLILPQLGVRISFRTFARRKAVKLMIKKLLKNHYYLTFFSLILSSIIFVISVYFNYSPAVQGVYALFLLCLLFPYVRKSLGTSKYTKTSLICGLLLAISCLTVYRFTIIQTLNITLVVIGFLFVYMFCFLFIKAFCLFLETQIERTTSDSAEPWSAKRVFWWVFAIAFVSLSMYWLASFPSRTTHDVATQLNQINGVTPYSNIHTIGHTIFLKFLFMIYDSTATVIFVQILMVSFLISTFARFLYEKGARYSWLIVLTIIFTACCFRDAAYMYPLKDAPYAICLGVCTYFIIRSVDSTSYKMNYGRVILLGVSMAFSVIFRHNGIVAFVFCGIYFIHLFMKTKTYKMLFVMTIVCAVCTAAVNFYSYDVLHAENPPNGYALQPLGSAIASVVANEGNITPSQYQRISQLLPIQHMKDNYVPWQGYYLAWTSEDFAAALGANHTQVIGLYFELLPGNPGLYIQDIIYNTHAIWGFTGESGFVGNSFLFILLFAAMAVSWNKEIFKKRWVIFLPVVANVLSIAVSTITNEARYFLPTFTLFMPLFVYILCTKRSNDHTEANDII